MKTQIPLLFAALTVAQMYPLSADGIHDLVKPDLDDLRASAEEERLKEEARLEQIRLEEEAKRLEEERKQAAIEAAKKDPLIDPESLRLAGESAGRDSYTIESGGTLGAIAADRYGSSQYFPVIEHWNGVNATKIYVGQVIKTPSIATIVKVKGAKVLARYPDEMTAMLQLRDDYMAIEPKLRACEGSPSDELKDTLSEMHATAKKIHAGFLVKRPGVQEYASGLLAQCKNVVDQFSAMKNGDLGRSNSRITRVHTCLAYAMRNAMVWGEEDFK
ncbi:LysM peptidoglycan-binding domain-containing protein [Roseibacillus persicicus]|uniref:LysM peptidoglycan-binding domain-containing protein n=1 Tax=Roseibacillus persicicus TaxID=454148 RepID=UPI00280D9004|nr:LysM peptidoglycan-binding domain-containing protein [Roseibacillus persicicus]MDQ8189494.1 LysM peptidoglycan-binding domain-containing protein [Roseibacillus persicicus]